MIKFSFDEILDIIESYQFEQTCIMDSIDTDNISGYKYMSASSKYDAACQIRNMIFDKFEEKRQEIRERKYPNEK